jgi:hypothetical protein
VEDFVIRGGPHAEAGRRYKDSLSRRKRIDTHELLGLANPQHFLFRPELVDRLGQSPPIGRSIH